MFKGFRDFLLRGNVVDLAVAVVIGAAFGAVVQSAVKDVLTPFIAAIVGTPDFSAIGFTIGTTHFPIGNFINALFSFVIIAAAIYFAVVVPVNAATARFKKPVAAPPVKICPECTSEIPAAAKRCKFCTSPQAV
jgi:large conductance mechanosensitive channel